MMWVWYWGFVLFALLVLFLILWVTRHQPVVCDDCAGLIRSHSHSVGNSEVGFDDWCGCPKASENGNMGDDE